MKDDRTRSAVLCADNESAEPGFPTEHFFTIFQPQNVSISVSPQHKCCLFTFFKAQKCSGRLEKGGSQCLCFDEMHRKRKEQECCWQLRFETKIYFFSAFVFSFQKELILFHSIQFLVRTTSDLHSLFHPINSISYKRATKAGKEEGDRLFSFSPTNQVSPELWGHTTQSLIEQTSEAGG